MVRELVLFTRSSNVLEVQRLRNKLDDTYLDASATVEVTLLDADGTAVSGQTWPAALTYVAASQGKFRVVLDADLAIVAGEWYEADLHITLGTLERHKRLPIEARDD